MELRAALPTDVASILSIYAHHVRHGLGTFETDRPISTRWRRATRRSQPQGSRIWSPSRPAAVVGYAYANQFRTRAAYRYTVEDSVYVAPDAQRRGIGKALLAELVARCSAQGLHQMLAVIGDSGNVGSIGVHRACGFKDVGVMKAVGRKFDRWVDVVIMQRALAPD